MDYCVRKNNIDGLEVFIKVRIGMPLTDEELKVYNSFDEDDKKMIFDFIDNEYFKDNFLHIVNKLTNNDDVIKQR